MFIHCMCMHTPSTTTPLITTTCIVLEQPFKSTAHKFLKNYNVLVPLFTTIYFLSLL